MTKLQLQIVPIKLAICRFDKSHAIPQWALDSKFCSITKTLDELSIVCLDNDIAEYIKAERGWNALKIIGPLDFALTGILSSVLLPLAENKISIFAISTYDTDYILIKETTLEKAIKILKKDFLILN